MWRWAAIFGVGTRTAYEDSLTMPRIRTEYRLLGCLALALGVFAGCVQPGSLDDKEEFQSLLAGDAALPGDSGAAPGSAGSPGSGSGSGGSGGSTSDAGDPTETGCAEACEIIEMRCATAGCHTGGSAASGLDLAISDFTMLEGRAATSAACADETLFDSANPETSLLYTKLLDPPACGIRMPLGLPLDDAEIDCIRRWIADPQCGDTAPTPDAGAGSDAGGSDSTMDAGADAMSSDPTVSVWIEAENTGTLTAPLAVQSEATAAGGEYIAVPFDSMLALSADPSASTDGIASYIFNVGTAGTYRIWGRLRIPTTDNDSFWVRIDGGTWYQWNNIPLSTDWAWDDVHDTENVDTVVDFELTAGQHTLNLAYREIGAELDKILITDDAAFTPSGEGQ